MKQPKQGGKNSGGQDKNQKNIASFFGAGAQQQNKGKPEQEKTEAKKEESKPQPEVSGTERERERLSGETQLSQSRSAAVDLA
jgi:predicted FMN-binding regulatory protein PaiB